jgi:Ala-tRNA(Pro) deacylase
MSGDVPARIRAHVTNAGAEFRELQHQPTRTSEDSARVRGEERRVGGKALLLKTDQQFRLFVVSAARRLDSGAIKRHFSAKKLRFATADELREMTGLVRGAVPPFGPPILPFELYVDESILEDRISAFNAGSLTTSFVMAVDDHVRIAKPTMLRFSE